MRVRVFPKTLRVEIENETRVFPESLIFETEMRVSQKSGLKTHLLCDFMVAFDPHKSALYLYLRPFLVLHQF